MAISEKFKTVECRSSFPENHAPVAHVVRMIGRIKKSEMVASVWSRYKIFHVHDGKECRKVPCLALAVLPDKIDGFIQEQFHIKSLER